MKTKYTFLIALGVALAALVLAGAGSAAEAQAAPTACVPGPHSGTITVDETWCLADSPHLMAGNVTVAAGATLTIEPGVTVQAAGVGLIVQGHLQAVGSAAQPITFTSQTDSGARQWSGIAFQEGTGLLRYAVVRNSGYGCYGCPGGYSAGVAALNVQTGAVTIESSQIITSAGGTHDTGLYVGNSRVVVSDTYFSGIGDSARERLPNLYQRGGRRRTAAVRGDCAAPALPIADRRPSLRCASPVCESLLHPGQGAWTRQKSAALLPA